MAQEYLEFAGGAGANTEAYADYYSDSQREVGNQPGLARSQFVNKVLQQTSKMMAVLADFIEQQSGNDVLDADTKADILANLTVAVQAVGFETTTAMWFYQDVAPTGWSIVTAAADAVLAVKGGTQAFNVAGGNQAGTWTQPGHVLAEAELPAHTHGAIGDHTHQASGAHGLVAATGTTADVYHTVSSTATGPAGGHTHNSVGSGSSHNHGTTYRPLAQVGIICDKD